MSLRIIHPPYSAPERIEDDLREQGYAILKPADMLKLIGVAPAEMSALKAGWSDLPPDAHLRDGGRYRRRRHSCFLSDGTTLTQVPHRAHFQPLQYNALHGGMLRMFEPVRPEDVRNPAWSRLLLAVGGICSRVGREPAWHIEAHQFRIDTTGGIGRPTPEGAHRDGVDFVAILLVERENIKGGESRVFEADGPGGRRFTLLEPWTLVILDDQRVIHETTPIQPATANGHRDTLVLTYRADGFLEAA